MKCKYLFAALAAVAALAACKQDPQPGPADADIKVSPNKLEATWEQKVSEFSITANCSWTISKTDTEGSAVDWVQCDKTQGTGNATLGVRVLQNPTGEARSATVTIFNGDVKAFIAVSQQANPDPDPDPDPKPKLLELEFLFASTQAPSGAMTGWPATNDDSWAALKNCDSGCATDNGGEAVATNSHRRAQVTYLLNGTGYDFTLADPNGAEKHNIRLDTKGVYVGTLRFFGLPAIEGKKLVKVEMVQGASNKNPETFFRNVGIAKWVLHKDVPVDQRQYVDGGEPQNQAVTEEGTVYTYELSGTAPNTVYWMDASTNASIIVSLKLSYADATGDEEPLGPEPADPTPEPEPDPDPDPEPDPDAVTYTFDFTGEPQEGWPTAKQESGHNPGVGTEHTYVLDGKSFKFVLADCGTAGAGQVFWVAPADEKPGYLAINAQYRYLGLPALSGYTLAKVECHNVKLSSTAPKMGITSSISQSATHPAAEAYVSGGALQTWDANGGGTYTYTLSGLSANTMYYLYGYAKGAIDILKLTYNPVK